MLKKVHIPKKRIERGWSRFFHSNVLICQDKNIEMVSLRFYTICIGLDQGVISGWNTHIKSHTDTHNCTQTDFYTQLNTKTDIYPHILTRRHTHFYTETTTYKDSQTKKTHRQFHIQI